MKVFHLIGYEERVGGIIPSVLAMSKALVARGIESTVVMCEGYPETEWEGIPVQGMRHARGDQEHNARRITAGLRFAQTFDPPSGDYVLHGHSRGGAMAAIAGAVLRRSPSVVTPHCYGSMRWAYSNMQRIPRVFPVALTQHMREYYQWRTDRSAVISECCAKGFAELADRRAARKVNSGEPIRFVGLGTLSERKRWNLILEAVAGLSSEERKKIQVTIRGRTGPMERGARYHDRLLWRRRELGLDETVHLLDPTVKVGEVLLGNDWFLLPSAQEPCSVALIEALSSGMPAIVARSGGSSEIVHEPLAGLVFEEDRVDELRSKLRIVIQNGTKVGTPQEIRDSVAERLPDHVAARYDEVYRDALATR